MPTDFRLDVQVVPFACSRALFSAGSSMAARMAMIAITINNSIRVNPWTRCELFCRLIALLPLFVMNHPGGEKFQGSWSSFTDSRSMMCGSRRAVKNLHSFRQTRSIPSTSC